MSYAKIYVHVIWPTKHRIPFLNSVETRTLVWKHIMENAKAKSLHLDSVNGHKDHCHCLISLSADHSISKAVNLIKGESSHWINKHKLCPIPFAWADKYYAISVSHSAVETVRKYIYNQESHHKETNFKKECDVIIKNIFSEYDEEPEPDSMSLDFM